MRFKGLDLNLLVALDTLLESRSIARTAELLHLSQPAISAALSRLRDFFQDELLVRHGRHFQPTAVAQALHPLIRQCLRDAEAIVYTTQAFDPSAKVHTFRIEASDYTAVTLLSRLARTLLREAPGVTLEVFPPEKPSAVRLQDGEVDLVLCPPGYDLRDQPSDLVLEDRYVFAGCASNPIFRRQLTASDIAGTGHVVMRLGRDRTLSYGEQQLDALGIERRIEVAVGSFAAAPWFLAGTSRLTLMHERMARLFARTAPITYAESPFPLARAQTRMQYHRARRNDPWLAWLRARILEEASASDW